MDNDNNTTAAQPLDLDKLSGDIMNIPCERTMSHFATRDDMLHYKEGHRDARHAAAELVNEQAAQARAARLDTTASAEVDERALSFGMQNQANFRAACERRGLQPSQELFSLWQDSRATLAPVAAQPEGYRLVPVKLTPEMRAAWDRAPQNEDDDIEFAGAYQAMIDAAPPVAAQQAAAKASLTGDALELVERMRDQADCVSRMTGSLLLDAAMMIEYLFGKAHAAKAPAAQAGSKLVPLVADKAMLHAGMRHFSDKREPATKAWECYRDMLAASPASAPEASQQAAAEPMVQYEHIKGGATFKHFAKDPLPKWASNVRPYVEPTIAAAVAAPSWTAQEIADACVKAGLGILECHRLMVTLKGTAPTAGAATTSEDARANKILRELVELRDLKADYDKVPHMHHVYWMRDKLADYETRWPAAWEKATAYARNAAMDDALRATQQEGGK